MTLDTLSRPGSIPSTIRPGGGAVNRRHEESEMVPAEKWSQALLVEPGLPQDGAERREPIAGDGQRAVHRQFELELPVSAVGLEPEKPDVDEDLGAFRLEPRPCFTSSENRVDSLMAPMMGGATLRRLDQKTGGRRRPSPLGNRWT